MSTRVSGVAAIIEAYAADVARGVHADPVRCRVFPAMPGSAKQRQHVEAFAPPAASGQHDGYWVTLALSGRQLDVAPGQRLLDALRNRGVEVPSSCETGNCGSCMLRSQVRQWRSDCRYGLLRTAMEA